MIVVMVMMVTMPVTAAAQLEQAKGDSGRDQDPPDDRVLRMLDGRSELQPDDHDHCAQDHRYKQVSHAGQPRETRDPCHRVLLGAPHHRQGNPLVRKNCVPEADAGGGDWSGGNGHDSSFVPAGDGVRPQTVATRAKASVRV